MTRLLVVLAVLAWIGGSVLLTPTTYGVGVLVAGCLFGILARVAQAGRQHREMTWLLRTGLAVPTSTPSAWACSQCHWEHDGWQLTCSQCGAARPVTDATTPAHERAPS
jgi:hypothetical protein